MAQKKRKSGKKEKKVVHSGEAYIQATFNNTIIPIPDQNGNVVAWSSAGAQGFKGSRKGTPYAHGWTLHGRRHGRWGAVSIPGEAAVR